MILSICGAEVLAALTDMREALTELRSRLRLPRGVWKRWGVKTLLFAAFTALVLNPNLKRAFLQVGHTADPEALIQTHFPGLAMINAQVDRLVAADAGRHSEARLVARFVLKNIRYVTDYENWGNVEYWPTAQEAWNLRQEDCDGRAILATSILRSRGFASAGMVVGLDHMWVKVNENEKDSSKPAHFVALLSPNPDFSLELHERSRFADLVAIMKALLHPAALRDTLAGLFADIPTLRKFLLVTGLLLFGYHPCRDRRGLLVVIAAGMAACALLARWQPGKGDRFDVIWGGLLLLGALAAAVLMDRLLTTRGRAPRPEPVRPECDPPGEGARLDIISHAAGRLTQEAGSGRN